MQTIDRSLLLPFNAQKLFNIIGNISEYPNFLPYVQDTEIHQTINNKMTASLFIKYGKIKHQLTTENNQISPLELKFKLVEGPLQSLEGYWKIVALAPAASKVVFNIEYRLNTALKHLGFNKLISGSIEHFILAFENHARNKLG